MVSLQNTILSYEEIFIEPNEYKKISYSKGTVMNYLEGSSNHSVFLYLVKLAGLQNSLDGNTLLLPGNDAVLKKISLNAVDKYTARKIVLYHTLSGVYTRNDLFQNQILQLNTLLGKGNRVLFKNNGTFNNSNITGEQYIGNRRSHIIHIANLL